jgi:hypothetical protein
MRSTATVKTRLASGCHGRNSSSSSCVLFCLLYTSAFRSKLRLTPVKNCFGTRNNRTATNALVFCLLPLLLLLVLVLLLLPFTTHLRALASSFFRFLDHTQWHNTVGRIPLDEWSARRRDLYLTNTQHSQQTNIHALCGVRTRNPSRRPAADPRLIPLGHWDRR